MSEAATQNVLIVTGASKGIGAACARLGARDGYAVAVNYNSDEDGAAAVVRDIRAAGGRAVAVQADLAKEADVVRLFETVDMALGPLTALVNNAGIAPAYGPIDRITQESLWRLWAVNVAGPFLACREAVKRMSTRHGGRGGAIVNLSSLATRLLGPGQFVDYAATKSAVDTLTLGLAMEVADQGIRVAGVSPGLIDTGAHARSGNPDRVAQVAPTLPLKRAGTSEEVAETVLWLLSDRASYVTRTIVEVAGGR